MRIVGLSQVGIDYHHQFVRGGSLSFPAWIEYLARAEGRDHSVRIGFSFINRHRSDRVLAVVWIDGQVYAEFIGADDFYISGEILDSFDGQRYPGTGIPDKYAAFNMVDFKTRVKNNSQNVWAIVSNISDHQTMIALAAIRRIKREEQPLFF